ncbi:MAG TPA: T9SS type A sorting domain-containing protein, partial [Ignavibacteria bacterium]|nr:T9SS type A sorting domain-containing protein [Ignavibacteria bacterium]
FNPATTISFALPVAGIVKLSVFDITGSKVSSLLNENMTAGNHSVSFNAAGLASGVYFYRIDVNGSEGIKFTDSRKMILVK